MSYTEEVYERVVAQNPGEPEFHQAVKEVLDSLKVVIDKNEEEYRKLSILERLVEPERIISFKVPWIDDNGTVQHPRSRLYQPQMQDMHNHSQALRKPRSAWQESWSGGSDMP